MLPRLVPAPPAGPGWLAEVKDDGVRGLAVKESAEVALYSGEDHFQ